MNFSEKSLKQREKLLEEADRLVEKLKSIGVKKVILFGSLARDESRFYSDIDLVIVMETTDKFVARIEKIYKFLDAKESLNILVYTPKEFHDMILSANGFMRKVMKEGKVLYDTEL
jgi:predicted nucleotidyltransferase